MAILPQFQRELLTWLGEVGPRLPAYVRLTKRTKTYVALALHPSRDIEAIVKDYEIDVAVTLPGTDQCWDLIYSELAPAKRERDGTYILGWPGMGGDRYPSRRAFWRGALFEPFPRVADDLLRRRRSCRTLRISVRRRDLGSPGERAGLC